MKRLKNKNVKSRGVEIKEWRGEKVQKRRKLKDNHRIKREERHSEEDIKRDKCLENEKRSKKKKKKKEPF